MSKKTPVIVIGLDAADPGLIEKWISQGYLKNLKKIREGGIYGRLNNTVNYCGIPTEYSTTEPLWATFGTGCRPHKTGYWDTTKYYQENYGIVCDIVKSCYDYKEFPPFYALGEDYKVAVFDVPVTVLSDKVNGVQILGWGGHYPYTVSDSQPSNIFPEIISKYKKNPVLHNDNGMWWEKDYIKSMQEALKTSIDGHKKIAIDLLKQQNWDLFMMVFGEPHTVGHDMYNYSQPDHPLYPYLTNNGTTPDPVLETYQQIDRAIGEILKEAPEDAYVLCFSLHGMTANYTDLLSMAVLPELLYRHSFPGKVALAPGKVGTEPGPIVTKPIRNSWPGEIWSQVYEPNPIKKFFRTWTHKKFLRGKKHGLLSPYSLLDEPKEQEIDMPWVPGTWYSSLWPEMKAFALPAFTNGHIRINLKGRDKDGIVEPSEYDALCDEITEILYRLKNGRTGEPLVKHVARTRKSPLENDPKLPDSDLVVVWNQPITDVVDSPDLGRIGPLTHARAGGHTSQGFLMAMGSGIAPNSDLTHGETVDLPATILELLGAPIPNYFEGKPLFNTSVVNAY
jgi:predicted AlkP superfamily phosphohydrolase/phosphomutase